MRAHRLIFITATLVSAIVADLSVWLDDDCPDPDRLTHPKQTIHTFEGELNKCYPVQPHAITFQVDPEESQEIWMGFLDSNCQVPESDDRFNTDCHTRQQVLSVKRIV
ncbi:hypothetical protein DM01DRAFT_1344681 [Hesseltinella vesiculosa]|uniref:Uncharacterized protein n=1 Tax=Hesseltinella vesiculosa TaxID=101127 RepID=A0A1X2GM19_9FUNG|nr:hypothetical protein DM01DRAFT_1344681 [Hesseltinella vesiculosa]